MESTKYLNNIIEAWHVYHQRYSLALVRDALIVCAKDYDHDQSRITYS